MPEQAEFDAGQAACPEPVGPRRLIGLWAICVLIGLGGMLALSFAFLGKPLGVLVFGALALISFTFAVGLWLRSNVVRIVTMVLLVLGCIASAIPFARDPQEFAALAVPLCAGVSILAYLWLRRKCFKVPREEKPRRVGATGAAALAIVVPFGIAFTLLLTVDDALEPFPRLEVELAPVPDQQNAYPLVVDMMERVPLDEDAELERVLRGARSPEPLEGEEWERAAADVMQRHRPCFEALGDVLARGSLAAPTHRSPLDWTTADNEWLSYCRALARLNNARVQLAIAQGRGQDGLDAASKSIELGLMLSERPNATITYLVGRAVSAMGLYALREAASSEGVTVAMLLPEIEHLASEDRLRRGIQQAYVTEFVLMRGAFEDIKDIRGIAGEEDPSAGLPGPALAALLRDPMPLLKVNMSRNLTGILLDRFVAGLDRYDPRLEPPRDGPFGMPSLGGHITWLHVLRNPLGDHLVTLLAPADARIAQSHFRALAELRLNRLFLALRCYQLEHGRLPESLDELVPEYFDQVPLDPFSEEPFRYEPAGDAPRLYSVGPDQQPAPDAEDTDDDVVELTFARPDNRG